MASSIQVTDVKFYPRKMRGILGFATVTLNDAITIPNITVCDAAEGELISLRYPQDCQEQDCAQISFKNEEVEKHIENCVFEKVAEVYSEMQV